jgi:hypothetical protein
MGAFYTNITVIGANPKDVLKWLMKRGEHAFVLADGNFSIVFDSTAETQDGSNSILAEELSKEFEAPVLAVTVHDDDVLLADAYDKGQKADSYNSSPGYWSWSDGGDSSPAGGNPAELVQLFRGGNAEELANALRHPYDFETDRHADIARVLGLPMAAIGFGYERLAQGDLPDGVDPGSLLEI